MSHTHDPRRPETHSAVPPAIDARKLTGAVRPDAHSPDFSYAVLADSDRAPTGDRRSFSRQRTRLRSGKLVDKAGRFITECLVHNRSASGCRLRLPTVLPLPRGLDFYDDQSGRLFQGAVVWQRDRDVGLRLVPCPPSRLNRLTAERMRAKFYGMRP